MLPDDGQKGPKHVVVIHTAALSEHSDKFSYPHSEGYWFEHRLGHQLRRLRFFVLFLSSARHIYQDKT
jgi:hypothetical protein